VSDDRPKSAYEITLEKLKARDRERGETAPASLTDEQKRKIADVRAIHEARLAEREILYRSERGKLLSDPEGGDKLKDLEEDYVRDRRRIEEKRDRAIEAVRAGGRPGRKSGKAKTST
jgi:hypothetical protein